ncbi:lipoprotein LpqH [Nocardia sp. X0981]
MNATLFRLGAAAFAASAALLLSACGDEATSTPAAPDATGKSVALVDGKALDGDFDTTCAKQGDTLALALTDTDNAQYGRLSVSAGILGDSTVQAVAIAGSRGGASGMPYAVGYGNGAPGGSAQVTRDGDTFTVTGEGVGAPDMADPMAGPATAKFELTFACSDIVGD